MAKKRKKKRNTRGSSRSSTGSSRQRLYPRVTLEDAIKVSAALKEQNGGNPWPPSDIASALEISKTSTGFFYLAAASRDFGLTEGSRDSNRIALTPLGRDLIYAPSPEKEKELKLQAFLKIDVFKRVLEYYRGSQLPEMRYLSNTLSGEFGLQADLHEEFAGVFRANCEYLNIGIGFSGKEIEGDGGVVAGKPPRVVTLAEPETATGLYCFAIMPFRERDSQQPQGFFDEVLRSLISPAGRKAGFKVNTANRQGSDVIQSTIVNDLLNADLVVADLTGHNPNVLFELGMRMANDKPVALIRARGTEPIFDVDNMLRVFEYDPNLWATTIERDLPKLTEHIRATWDKRDSNPTYMKILKTTPNT